MTVLKHYTSIETDIVLTFGLSVITSKSTLYIVFTSYGKVIVLQSTERSGLLHPVYVTPVGKFLAS